MSLLSWRIAQKIDIESLILMDYVGDSALRDPGYPFALVAKPPLTPCTLALLYSLATALSASAQLRIVTYNTAGEAYIGSGTNRIDTVLTAIGEEIGNNTVFLVCHLFSRGKIHI